MKCYREGSCIHFNGTQSGSCDAGVIYRDHVGGPDTGWMARLPCNRDEPMIEGQVPVPCKLKHLPTDEQIAESDAEMVRGMERMRKARTAIVDHIGEYVPGKSAGAQGTIDCPNCGGQLSFTRASLNGHIHAKCSTRPCVWWMEQERTMPVVDLQRRARQIGRIRLGFSEPTTKNGKTYKQPKRSDTLILTSADKHALTVAASKYGGIVKEWTEAGQFFLKTDCAELPIFVVDVPESQWYEAWQGGECKRRCDGQTIQGGAQAGAGCVCPADPLKRLELAKLNPPQACGLITRISVMLPDVPDLGVWRLDTHGYYAATELPTTIEFLRGALKAGRPYIPATLAIEQRKSGTKRFPVPVIRLQSTATEIVKISGPTAAAAIERPKPAQVEGRQAPALEAPAAQGYPAYTVAEIEAQGEMLPCRACGATVAWIKQPDDSEIGYDADARPHDLTCGGSQGGLAL